MVIGKKGEDIEALKAELRRMMGVPVHVNIEEIRKPEIDAQLIADSIAQQLEKRIMFRRAMKRAMQNAMRLGAQGIKIMSAGRLNGIEIARTEWYREGRVPLHTLRADIDYGFGEAKTTYGVIGIKVWVFKGEIMPKSEQLRRPRRWRRRAVRAARGAGRAEAAEEAGAEARRQAPARPKPEAPRRRRQEARAPPKKPMPLPRPKTAVKKPAKKVVKDDEARRKRNKPCCNQLDEIPQGAEGPQHRASPRAATRCASASTA